MKFYAFVTLILFSQFSFALSETSLSANARLTQVNADNSQKTTSFTASYAHFFWQQSALEFSFTSGRSKLISQPSPTDSEVTLKTFFELYGLDLLLVFGDRNTGSQPYFKLGVAYLDRKIFRDVQGLGGGQLASTDGIVPSIGAGLKFKITDRLSFKTGVDAWTTPLDEDDISIDYAARLGFSWIH